MLSGSGILIPRFYLNLQHYSVLFLCACLLWQPPLPPPRPPQSPPFLTVGTHWHTDG